MDPFIIILILFVTMISALLLLVALKYRGWIISGLICLCLGTAVLTSMIIYEQIGYPKNVTIFQKKWHMHHYVPSDQEQKFYILIQEGDNLPRLIAFHVKDKENYEKQKGKLNSMAAKLGEGEYVEGEFDTETQEFIEHKLSAVDKFKKDRP